MEVQVKLQKRKRQTILFNELRETRTDFMCIFIKDKKTKERNYMYI